MKNPPAPPDGPRALSAYRLPDEHRRMRIVAWLVAWPVFVALFPVFGIILPGLLAIVLYVVLLEWGREDKHDPWALLAVACFVAGASRAALTDHIIATSGASGLGDDATADLPDFALFGAAFLSAAFSLVSLHLRPRRHGTILALCCLVQAPYAAALQYCFLYGPAFVADFYRVPSVTLVHSNHAWTSAWSRDLDHSEYRVRADGNWVLRPPACIGRLRPPFEGRIPLVPPTSEHVNTRYGLTNGAWYDIPAYPPGGEMDEEAEPDHEGRAYPIALLVEAEVPWLWIESELQEFDDRYGHDPWFPAWSLHVVVASVAPDGKRSLPLRLLLDRRLADDEGGFPIKRLVIDRKASIPGAPVEYGFDGRFELDPGPIAEMVGACWAAGGTVELDLDPELPWAEVVDFLDRTWIGAEAQDRVCRIVLPER